MGWEYKYKTSSFGTDGECYAARLLQMLRVPTGSLMPDLVSAPGTYDPHMAIEVKTGRDNKGVMVAYQLQYALKWTGDYDHWWPAGRKPAVNTDLLSDITPQIGAYYYMVLDRPDGVRAAELNTPFAAIRLGWGNVHLVPHQVAFYEFCVNRHLSKRTPPGQTFQQTYEEVQQRTMEDYLSGASNWAQRKTGDDWKNLYGRDMLALYHNDLSQTTAHGRRRVQLLQQHCPLVASLNRTQLPGPNGTSIYVIHEPEHNSLFREQLADRVRQSRPVIEEITRERRDAVSLLDRLLASCDPGQINGNIDADSYLLNEMSMDDFLRLSRLVEWREANAAMPAWGSASNELAGEDAIPVAVASQPVEDVPF